MKLSICIVNYNSGRLLAACLEAIERFAPTCDYEVIAVDNGSTDGSQNTSLTYPYVHFIQNVSNVGFARANNQAFACSRGAYMLMLNADTEVMAGMFDSLLACAEAYPRAGLVTAKLVNPDGSPQVGFNIRRLPSMLTVVAQLILLDELFPHNSLTRRYLCLDFDYGRIQAVEQPAASALLYSRSAWAQVGGFDERFPNWYNDVDLCKRVLDMGWEILFCPSAQVMHYGGMGVTSRLIAGIAIEAYRSQRYYFLKHFGRVSYRIVSGLVIVGMILRLLVLRLFPKTAGQVHTRAKDREDGLSHAFSAVLRDTWQTWAILPAEFTMA